MPEPTRPRDWADRLGSEELPPAVAVWYAQWGSNDQRHDVAMDCAFAGVEVQCAADGAAPGDHVAEEVIAGWGDGLELFRR